MTRVALDLMGGDDAPACVVEGALLALDDDPSVAVLLVGPVDVAEPLLDARRPGWRDGGRLSLVAASEVVGMDEDPARAVRRKRDATVRVAARLVRDGEADAMLSVGSTGATLAADVFTLGRLRGVHRPPLAAVVPAQAGPVVLLDAGATLEATPELLVEFALAGAAFATVRLGLDRPRIALLTIGEEAGKGDTVRKRAFDLLGDELADLPVEFVGNVEGHDVPHGGRADVVVSDGFTGNVLLKGLEGAAAMLQDVVLDAVRATGGGDAVAGAVRSAIAPLLPDQLGGAVLLGVDGVVVVGHGASSARAVASGIAVASQAARDGLVPRIAQALADLAERRAAARDPEPVEAAP